MFFARERLPGRQVPSGRAGIVGFLVFYPLLDFGHKLEIRLFFRKRGLKVQRIRGFRNHYRVDYLDGGRKMSGMWPKDFKNRGAASDQKLST
jgi:hypothetical protein